MKDAGLSNKQLNFVQHVKTLLVQHGRWRAYDYDEIINRDKASLDIFWIKDESLEDSDNLPEPSIIATEIIEDLQAALEPLQEIAEDLGQKKAVTLKGYRTTNKKPKKKDEFDRPSVISHNTSL